MTYNITTTAASYIIRKVRDAVELDLTYAWVGGKIVATASGNSYNGTFVFGHKDRQSLREFCRQASGHNHFHHITVMDYALIGKEAVKFANAVRNGRYITY